MKIKKTSFIVVTAIILIFINIIDVVIDDDNLQGLGRLEISKPIINIEKDDVIKTKIQENSFPIQYNFCINNYIDNKVNKIECEYQIELENSVSDFPVSYTLIECDKEEEILLIDGKSEKMKIKKDEKESRKFKLIVNWKEQSENYSDELAIKLKINVEQENVDEI